MRRTARGPIAARHLQRWREQLLSGPAAVTGGAGPGSAAGASGVGAARSRSLRDDDENSRLRSRLGGALPAPAAPRSGAPSPRNRARSRAPASSCHGAGDEAEADCFARWLGAIGFSAPVDPRRPRGSCGSPLARAAAAGLAGPRRRAMFCSSRTTTARPSMMMPVQAATAPARIRVLPNLNSLTGIPKAIARRPASENANPGNQQHRHHQLPQPRSSESQQPMSRYRHIADIAIAISDARNNRTSDCVHIASGISRPERDEGLYPHRKCCIASGKLRHNSQLLDGGTALYGCRGNEAQKR